MCVTHQSPLHGKNLTTSFYYPELQHAIPLSAHWHHAIPLCRTLSTGQSYTTSFHCPLARATCTTSLTVTSRPSCSTPRHSNDVTSWPELHHAAPVLVQSCTTTFHNRQARVEPCAWPWAHIYGASSTNHAAAALTERKALLGVLDAQRRAPPRRVEGRNCATSPCVDHRRMPQAGTDAVNVHQSDPCMFECAESACGACVQHAVMSSEIARCEDYTSPCHVCPEPPIENTSFE
jgi:hypothetical protein